MTDSPLVSVIIPCYNYGNYVSDAVDSVLRQTLPGVELIVIEGGSDDGTTIEAVKKLDQSKMKVFFRDKRYLVGNNRNYAIQRARGKYICCLDADDTLDATYLEKAVYLMEKYGYDLVSTSLRFVGKESGEPTCSIIKSPTLKCMTESNQVFTCAVFRRIHWEISGGYFDYGIGKEHIAEDWDLWIRLAALGAHIRNISNEYLLHYRIHAANSLSHSACVRPIEEQRTVILERNKSLLTSAAFEYSTAQNEKRINTPIVETDLVKVFADPKEDIETLMIVTPNLLIGGVERLLCALTNYLMGKGWRIIIVSTDPQNDNFGNARDWFNKQINEIFCLPKFLDEDEWPDFIKYLIISRRPHYIINTGSSLMYQLLPEIKQLAPASLLIDILFNVVGHTESHKKYKKYFDLAIAETDEVYHWFLQESGWKKDCVKKIMSGVDLKHYQPRTRSSALIEKFNIQPSDFIIGFSGRLSEEKGPDIFVEIAKLCANKPNVRFLMTGAGTLHDALLQQINQLPESVRFTFLGQVESIAELFSVYDILILPSRYDGRPFVVMEALASGVPVIASSVGSLPEMIQDGSNGYLCSPGNAGQFAEYIFKLTEDITQLKLMKLAARSYAERHLDADIVFAGYEEAITGIKTQLNKIAG